LAPPPAPDQREREAYPSIGREEALLELERALRRKPAGILIDGLNPAIALAAGRA
jgi:hypothetical protein